MNDFRSSVFSLIIPSDLVTALRAAVQHFLQRAHQALKPFGGGVNPLKTKVRCDAEENEEDKTRIEEKE
jgi:hypothetical protein